jgi:hypothetical protein
LPKNATPVSIKLFGRSAKYSPNIQPVATQAVPPETPPVVILFSQRRHGADHNDRSSSLFAPEYLDAQNAPFLTGSKAENLVLNDDAAGVGKDLGEDVIESCHLALQDAR